MSVETPEDREMFLDPEDFGTEVFYLGKTIYGIFDSDAYMVDDGQQQFTTEQITLEVRTSDISGMRIGAVVNVENINYTVKDIQHDSTGMTSLMLYIQDE